MELIHAIIILLVIRAVAALHLVVILHAAVLCKPVQVVIGNQAMAAQAALTTAVHMDGNLNGVGAVLVGIRLASVVDSNTANLDAQMQLQFVYAY